MQTIVLLVSLAGMAVVAGAFIVAVRASGAAAEVPADTERRRSRLLWGLIVLGVVVTAGTLWQWPHDVSAGSGAVTVNVTGAQWSWEIDRETVPANTVIVFNVHATDVNHGMGIYNEAGTLLTQTQGMPGYVNQVRYVFDEPGMYRVLCMEFCGVAHHEMIHEFEVVASEG